MFGPDSQDQQQSQNQQPNATPPGMAPALDHSLPMLTPDSGADYGAPALATTAPSTPASADGPGNDDLLEIKQQALQHLSPLVGHLEQTPEEKFRTTMMMIQASDDQSLIKVAYEAAQAIPDEKARAQALLDIVNEINYFTQQKS
jgi:hypothetical protein